MIRNKRPVINAMTQGIIIGYTGNFMTNPIAGIIIEMIKNIRVNIKYNPVVFIGVTLYY